MRTLAAKLVLLVVVLLSSTALLKAQDSAAMSGTVTDSTGALIPGTVVTLTNKLRGVSFTQTADKQGSYHFANVPPGDGYTVTFTHDGFSTSSVNQVTLNVGLTRTQDGHLSAGSTETVAVTAGNESVTLDTTDATIGNNLDVHQLNNLPIYDRTAGISTLFIQQPGVDSYSGAVTGARTDQTSVSVDGLDVNDVATGQAFEIVANAPVDSVEQFTGTVAGLTSSVGTGAGGQFQLVTKSGTNKFHGNINEYHRDVSTVANTWFNNLNDLPRTPYIQNQFGGNIGGPIHRDKLFFFFDYAGSRITQSSTAEPTVPLNNLRSATPTLNYINSGNGCDDTSRLNLDATCISTLSATQVAGLDPAGTGFDTDVLAYLISRYPAANDLSRGDGVNTGGYRFTTPTPRTENTYVGRVDYNLTSSQKIFGRFTINRLNGIETLPEFPTDPVTHPEIDSSYAYVVSHIWTIGRNKVNQFYYGDTISKLNFPDNYNPTGANQYSFTGLSGPYTSFDGQKRRIPIPMVRDDFNWQIGSHSLTFGGTFKFIKTNSNLVSNFIGVEGGLTGGLGSGLDPSVRPSDIYTSQAGIATTDYDELFATTLGALGSISTSFNYNNAGVPQQAGSGGPRAYRFFQTETYIGDTWKVTPKLTVSYGLRYQLYSVPYEVHGDESVQFDQNTNKPIDFNSFIKTRLAQASSATPVVPISSYKLGGKANNGPNLYDPSYKDFAPRIAFSYSATPKTVVNASAGIVYDRSVINAVNFLQDQLSYLFSNSNTNNLGSGSSSSQILATVPRFGSNLSFDPTLDPSPLPVASPFTPYVDGNGNPYGLSIGEVNFIPAQNLKDPYSIALNAGVQQEFPGHLIMKLNYVGRLGRRLLANADANQVIDVPDTSGLSSQAMATAFGNLTKQLRAGVPFNQLAAQPWFEDVLAPYGPGFVYDNNGDQLHNNTQLVGLMAGALGNRGDISDMLQTLANYTYNYGYTGFLPNNVGIPSQFGTNEYLTNMGSSNYHGLLLTLSKNLSQGLRFDFNYTWSHSIDNTSLISNSNPLTSANPTGLICDVLQPRACRGNSDFDVRQEIESNFVYELPFGRGKAFLGSAPRWADEAIGGWSFSGLPSYRTGLSMGALSHAFLASFENDDPAIFTGNPGDLKVKVNTDHSSNTVYAFAGGLAGANKVFNEFRGPIGIEYGQRNLFKGPGAFYFDAGLAKSFPIILDKVNLQFRADAFNVFNHPVFDNPTLDIVANASPFGQITGTSPNADTAAAPDGARVAQFSLRLEF
jgi:hypothetical protein